MTTKMFRGFLFATTAATVLAAAGAQAASPPPKITTAVGKALNDAQTADTTKDFAAAKTAIAAAQAVAGRTPYDDYTINRVILKVDLDAGDNAGAAAAAEFLVASPAAPNDEEKAQNLKLAVVLENNNKAYDKATAYAKQLMATNPTDPQTITVMAQAMMLGGDNADALALTQKSVDAATAAGQKPNHDVMEMLMTAQSGAKDEAGAEKTLEMLVQDYNVAGDWAQMIDIALGTQAPRNIDTIWLGRLAAPAGATLSAQDASIVGQSANQLADYGDAQMAFQGGGTGFPNPAASIDKDKKAIPAEIALEQKQNGTFSAKMADALFGYGMYPEAEAAARLAIQKGNATDPSEAPMVLGQTLFMEGKYDDAIAAFQQVKGGSPATARIARLWIDLAQAKKAPPAAAPAAPAAAAAK